MENLLIEIDHVAIAVLCAAEREGLGVSDPATRERVGEGRLTVFRRHDQEG